MAISRVVAACGSAIILAASAVTVSGCGGKKVHGSKVPARIAMVTDVGGPNDRSFNAAAYKGLRDAEKELGVDIRVLPSSSTAEYVPNLASLARQNYDLIIGVGFLMTDALDKVATKFSSSNFAIIDVSQSILPHKPKNVHGLVFEEKQAGYLAGYLAALFTKKKGGKQVVSAIGGQSIPPVQHYIGGYYSGAKAADPNMKVLVGFSEDFADQAKCKEVAINQLDQGSQVVFPVAGQCGLGALDAAKGERANGIGVDSDQGYLGSYVLTSAIKKIDVAVVDTIKDVIAGRFRGGVDTVFDVKSNGVGLSTLSAQAKVFQGQINRVRRDIASGKIQNILEAPPQ